MDKRLIVKKFQEKILEAAQMLEKSAKLSHAYAIDTESKAEDKYDTRGLEAAYLAEGQARLATETLQAVALYETLPIKDFAAGDPIAVTALVELLCDEVHHCYFIGPKNGGTSIDYEGRTIVLITPTSPLGQMLLGKRAGDDFEMKIGQRISDYEILSVY